METLIRPELRPYLTPRPLSHRKSATTSTINISTTAAKQHTHIAATGARGFGEPSSTPKSNKATTTGNNPDEKPRRDDDDEEIPKEVFDRMIRRILWFVGAPMVGGVGSLYAMELLQQRGLWGAPKWVPFATILVAFGTSAMGIAYGTLSSSWEEGRKGSLLGWEEVQRNWPQLWEEEEKEKEKEKGKR